MGIFHDLVTQARTHQTVAENKKGRKYCSKYVIRVEFLFYYLTFFYSCNFISHYDLI